MSISLNQQRPGIPRFQPGADVIYCSVSKRVTGARVIGKRAGRPDKRRMETTGMYEGKLVRLRALESSDIAPSHEFVNNYETMRGVTSGMLYPSSFEDETRWANGQSSYTHGEYQFGVETLKDGVFIGRCGFIRVDWKNRLAELGILIGDKNYRGHGFGSDAVNVLCRFGFEELNLHKVKASVFDFNEGALRAYEKCGFVREGRLKSELFREGAYHDVIEMGLLSPYQT